MTKNKSMKGVCKLCNEYKELQRKNHIIPEFLYKEGGLFHQKNHNLIALDINEYFKYGKEKILSYKKSSGEYEEYKLCNHCDKNIIGAYESYARVFLYGKEIPIKKRPLFTRDKDFFTVENIDYRKLKLFYLSILWRSSFSQKKIFSEINLDVKSYEEIREMILNGIPKSDQVFPIIFMTSVFDKSITSDYLFQPIEIKINDEISYVFAMGGMFIFFYFGKTPIPMSLGKSILRENGTISILKLPSCNTWDFLKLLYPAPAPPDM